MFKIWRVQVRIFKLLFNPVPCMALCAFIALSCMDEPKKPVEIITPPVVTNQLIENTTTNEIVIQATKLANECLKNVKFLTRIDDYLYKYTDKSPQEVALVFAQASEKGYVKFYKHWNPFSSVLAYREGNNIFLNSRKFPRELLGVFKTLIHEYAHILGFGHPFEVTEDRPDSVPYKVEDVAASACLNI